MATAVQVGSTKTRLVRHALILAWLTVGWNVAEAVLAVGFGVAQESVALFGFGLDSLVEVGAASLVLWRLRGELASGALLQRSRERAATQGIGLALMGLAGIVIAGSGWSLAGAEAPDSTVAGLVVATVSVALMVYLWLAKTKVAVALDSRTLRADAACSRACLQLSVVLMIGSLLYLAVPSLWWVDAVAALGIGGLIAREGWQTWSVARRPDFDGGGCGCG